MLPPGRRKGEPPGFIQRFDFFPASMQTPAESIAGEYSGTVLSENVCDMVEKILLATPSAAMYTQSFV